MARPKKTTTRTTRKATPKTKAKSQTKAKTTRKPRAQAKKQTRATTKATPKHDAQKAFAQRVTPNAKEQTEIIKLLKSTYTDNTRRPPNNPDMPNQIIGFINADLNQVKSALEEYAAHLRALDRKRKNSTGMKRQGFVDRALELAEENPEFLPHYVTLEKFQDDYQYFVSFRALLDLSMQIAELIRNITIQASDIVYTDALEYYNAVKEAAKRRVDPAETLAKELGVMFKRMGSRIKDPEAPPTIKQTNREIRALERGTKSGRVVIENIKPKITGGVRKIEDETFTDKASFKETEEGEIKE